MFFGYQKAFGWLLGGVDFEESSLSTFFRLNSWSPKDILLVSVVFPATGTFVRCFFWIIDGVPEGKLRFFAVIFKERL